MEALHGELPSGVDRLRVGEAVIYRIPDIDGIDWPARALFKDIADSDIATAAASLPRGVIDVARKSLRISFNCYLIQTQTFVALIDAGVGNDKQRLDRPAWHQRRGPFLATLAALGFPPERIDLVVNTHLHADHVGWNTVRDGESWRPTFPRARYVTSAREFTHWSGLHDADPANAVLHGAYADSVLPLLAAGALDCVEPPCVIAPGLRLEPAAGHSPGMMIAILMAGDAEVAFLADVVHHPIQLSAPTLCSNFCASPAEAIATRMRVLGECADRGAIIATYHFAAPAFGRLERRDAHFRLIEQPISNVRRH